MSLKNNIDKTILWFSNHGLSSAIFLNTILPVLSYTYYGFQELSACFQIFRKIDKSNYKEKLINALIKLSIATLYLLTAMSLTSLACFNFLPLLTGLILAAVGATISWIMIDILKFVEKDTQTQDPLWGFWMVAGLWLLPLNILVASPVAVFGMSSILTVSISCMTISAIPLLIKVANGAASLVKSGYEKITQCFCVPEYIEQQSISPSMNTPVYIPSPSPSIGTQSLPPTVRVSNKNSPLPRSFSDSELIKTASDSRNLSSPSFTQFNRKKSVSANGFFSPEVLVHVKKPNNRTLRRGM